MMCARCEELEERVAWLESELGMGHDLDRLGVVYDAIKQQIDLHKGRAMSGTRAPAKMVLALYRAKGRPMTKEQILEAVPPASGEDDDRNTQIVNVWMSFARKALGADAIHTIYGLGFQLTAVGIAKIDALLNPSSRSAAA